jgi:hypothetical protein
MSTYAGTGARGYGGDGGPALAATWGAPKAIRCDRHDNLLVVDTENHAIRRIDAVTGLVTTIAGGHQGGEGDAGPATSAGPYRRAMGRPESVVNGRVGAACFSSSRIVQYSHSRRTSVWQITPETLLESITALYKGEKSFRAILDRSQYDTRFEPIHRWSREHAVQRINPAEVSKWSEDKATMDRRIRHSFTSRTR